MVQPPPPSVDNRPIVFSWDSAEPEFRPTYVGFRDSLLSTFPADKLLEVVGLYAEGEAAPKGFANMGLARAAKIKAKLLAEVPSLKPEQIVESSRLVTMPVAAKTEKFAGVEFAFRDKPKGDEVEIVEVDNTITILFPYGKSVKEADPRVDDYLAKLAERLKQTDETVSITGHTDDSGTVEYNQGLGLARAKFVRDILVEKGIKKERISTDSKGELEPVASNETEEGSRQNRRVVLVLNKKVTS